MIKKLLFIAVFFSALATYAQGNGVISGKITDRDNNFSLPGATIRITDGTRYHHF